jgi:hypothetical protein
LLFFAFAPDKLIKRFGNWLYAIAYRKTETNVLPVCSFPARFTFSELVDRIALAGSSQDRQQLGQGVAWWVG